MRSELDVTTQKFANKDNFDERFPCDSLGLARLSYVKSFQDSRTQGPTLRYVD